ncbi:MAG: hypothetical protein AB7O24_16285 [Kofleriaceae bacterium]
MRLITICVLTGLGVTFAPGCSNKTSEPKPAAPDPTESAHPAPPSSEQTPSERPPVRSDRPAVVTVEMEATLEAMIAAYERITTEIGKAGADCTQATQRVAAFENEQATLDAFRKMGSTKFPEQEPAFQQWYVSRYEMRLSAGLDKMIRTLEACEKDAEFTAAWERVASAMQPK